MADELDNAAITAIADLCGNGPAQALYKIATKKKNSDELRRNALERMMEVSRECATASSNRLTQFHHKMINAAYDVIDFTEIESRQIAVECFQYVILQPDENQPPEGSISRGQKLANVALTDSDVNIRLWALEALVTLRGNNNTVINTLRSATSDPVPIVKETAQNMLNELL